MLTATPKQRGSSKVKMDLTFVFSEVKNMSCDWRKTPRPHVFSYFGMPTLQNPTRPVSTEEERNGRAMILAAMPEFANGPQVFCTNEVPETLPMP